MSGFSEIGWLVLVTIVSRCRNLGRDEVGQAALDLGTGFHLITRACESRLGFYHLGL